jgi:hypothetical protein
MLTVWCLNWGDKYSDYYVQRLQQSVSDYVTLKHRFICITEREIEGVETIPPVVVWPGWWGKIQLFKPGFADDYNLWLDLDVVITGNLDNMILQYSGEHMACAKNWAASGWGGCQSSVMLWKGGKGCQAEIIYRTFDPTTLHWPPVSKPGVLWGDQEWITILRNTGRLAVTHFDPALVQSYKYHCRDGLPDGAKIIVFHGEPKPSECRESWYSW